MFDSSALLEETRAMSPVTAEHPIFRHDSADYAMFYAPGFLCVASPRAADRFEAAIAPSGDGLGGELWCRAEAATAAARRKREQPFRPECLTLYLNNECNLDCTYCYATPAHRPSVKLDLEAVAAAAAVVAQNCHRKGRPFYTVFHGGGEPTLHRERVERALALLDAAADAHAVERFGYVATHGVMSAERAAWLAHRFDLVGLSCDGPPDIQNSQRPRWGGGDTSPIVERTGRVLREEGCALHVRATITPATVSRQAEIADYICTHFAPQEIHVEPAYRGGKAAAASGLQARHAATFVTHFLEARQVAESHGIYLMCSSSRPDAIHGPYCHVFQDTLNLVPGGVATACFKACDAERAAEKGVIVGALNRNNGRFEIDFARVQTLRQRLSAPPATCFHCFNRYHCVWECPDRCPLDDEASLSRPRGEIEMGDAPQRTFRCLIAKALTYVTLRETAEQVWAQGKGLDEDVRGIDLL